MSDKPCSRENGFRVDCIKHYAEVEAENARLKAEVERLTEDNRQLTKAIEIADGVIKRMGNAAKEGKQS